ncbi:hypothetical protein BX666DRAFT_2023800 [Dichotomocladium elegans]|nr:hypothetical protein BX666DRAFT_2023800 [Dichotomocladium elegans]
MYTTIYIPQDESIPCADYHPCDAIQIPYTDDDDAFSDDRKRRRSLLRFASDYSLSSASSGSDDEPIEPYRAQKRQRLPVDPERRTNHVASEQKRRITINTAFRDMSELIPGLNNAPHSKSEILFTAYDYIQHLKERNHKLRDRVAALHMRASVGNHNSYPCLNIPADEYDE